MDVSVLDRVRVDWDKPVYVRIGYGSSEAVSGPQQALDYLQHRWPIVDGIYHDLAVTKCVAAINRNGPAAVARDVFISAAIEAYVLA